MLLSIFTYVATLDWWTTDWIGLDSSIFTHVVLIATYLHVSLLWIGGLRIGLHWVATYVHVHTATYCNILQHTATHCNTLQHTAESMNEWTL